MKSLYQFSPLLLLVFSLLPIDAAVLNRPLGLTNPALNSSSFLDNAPNSTGLGTIDPTKMDIKVRYGVEKLPATAVLMSAVNAMVKLALEDWQGQIAPTSFIMDDSSYSQIEIRIEPLQETPGSTFIRAFAVLGVYEVMANVLSNPTERFKAVQGTLFYDGREVGFVLVQSRTAGPASAPGSISTAIVSPLPAILSESSTKNQSTNGHMNKPNATALSAPAWVDPRLKVDITQGLDSFTVYEVFFFVYAMLRTAAMEAGMNTRILTPRNAQVKDFTTLVSSPPITRRGQPIAVSFKNVGDPPRSSRNPPYFAYGSLIRALGQLPQYMLDRRDFRDVLMMTLTYDGVQVGEGYIVRQQLSSESVQTS